MIALFALERDRREDAVRRLARELEVPEALAAEVYEREWERLRDGARVDQFVGVLAEKHASAALKNRNGP